MARAASKEICSPFKKATTKAPGKPASRMASTLARAASWLLHAPLKYLLACPSGMGIWLMAGIFDRAVGLGLLRNTPICTLYTGCRSLRAVVPCGPGFLGAAETFSECALSDRKSVV